MEMVCEEIGIDDGERLPRTFPYSGVGVSGKDRGIVGDISSITSIDFHLPPRNRNRNINPRMIT